MELFEEKKEKEALNEATKEIQKHLLRMRSILDTLKREDRSQDSPFLNEFSHIWHALMDDADNFKKTTAWTHHFRSFLKAIQHYPEGQEHTLGYYLTEYAGKTWLPFPYMEMIAKIYREHQKVPIESTLELWTKRIDELLKG